MKYTPDDGWVYSLAVDQYLRNRGLGSELLAHAENMLAALGCLKVNLQIMEGNEEVRQFYQANGFKVEKRISMGKRLPK